MHKDTPLCHRKRDTLQTHPRAGSRRTGRLQTLIRPCWQPARACYGRAVKRNRSRASPTGRSLRLPERWGRTTWPWRRLPRGGGRRWQSRASLGRCRSIFWPMCSTATPHWPTPAGQRRRWRLGRQGAKCWSFTRRTSPRLYLWQRLANWRRCCIKRSRPCGGVLISSGGSAASRRFSKSPASGTRPARSSRCWCKWPRRPRGCWRRIGRASSSGIGRTTRWSAGRRWDCRRASCESPTIAAWWAR